MATLRDKAGRIRRERLRAAGLTVMVDAEPIRDHITRLVEAGVTENAIAHQCGISRQAISLIRRGHTRQVRRSTADKLLAVTHRPHPTQRLVPAIGALRRLRALQAIGWTTTQLGDRLGMLQTHVAQIQHRDLIAGGRWRQIADLYERLSATPGSSSITRQRAAAKGWLLPMEWEGYDIDDPRVVPPRSARTAKPSRAGSRQDRLELVGALLVEGVSRSEMAARLGMSVRQIERDVKTVKGEAA
ncbi:helix-turn-helix domain-containing protein [Promicromonospora sukumoe]